MLLRGEALSPMSGKQEGSVNRGGWNRGRAASSVGG